MKYVLLFLLIFGGDSAARSRALRHAALQGWKVNDIHCDAIEARDQKGYVNCTFYMKDGSRRRLACPGIFSLEVACKGIE